MKPLLFPVVLMMVGIWADLALATDCRLGAVNYERAKAAVDRRQGIEWLQRSVEACPNFNAWYMLGRLYTEEDRLDPASHAFAQARKMATTSQLEALALGRQGEIFSRAGQRPEALRALEAAHQFHPAPAPDWLKASLRKVRIQSHREIMAADDITSLLSAGDQSGKFAVRPAVNLPVHFEFDRADLNATGRRQVMELGRALSGAKMRPGTFLLVGHTDKRGSRAYNQMLSERRAETVKIELERQFPALISKLEATGRGETQLLYDGDDDTDHMLNRRVKITLIPH